MFCCSQITVIYYYCFENSNNHERDTNDAAPIIGANLAMPANLKDKYNETVKLAISTTCCVAWLDWFYQLQDFWDSLLPWVPLYESRIAWYTHGILFLLTLQSSWNVYPKSLVRSMQYTNIVYVSIVLKVFSQRCIE